VKIDIQDKRTDDVNGCRAGRNDSREVVTVEQIRRRSQHAIQIPARLGVRKAQNYRKLVKVQISKLSISYTYGVMAWVACASTHVPKKLRRVGTTQARYWRIGAATFVKARLGIFERKGIVADFSNSGVVSDDVVFYRVLKCVPKSVALSRKCRRNFPSLNFVGGLASVGGGRRCT